MHRFLTLPILVPMLLGVALLFAGVSVIVCALYVDRTFRDAAHFFDGFDDDSPLL